MTLTKEYFDKAIKNLANKDELDAQTRDLKHELEAQMGALYEKFADDQKLLTEGVLEINTRLKKTESDVAIVKRTTSDLNNKVDILVEGQKGLAKRVERNEIRLDAVEAR